MLLIILMFMIISISTNYEEIIIMKTICEVNLICFILHQIYYEK